MSKLNASYIRKVNFKPKHEICVWFFFPLSCLYLLSQSSLHSGHICNRFHLFMKLYDTPAFLIPDPSCQSTQISSRISQSKFSTNLIYISDLGVVIQSQSEPRSISSGTAENKIKKFSFCLGIGLSLKLLLASFHGDQRACITSTLTYRKHWRFSLFSPLSPFQAHQFLFQTCSPEGFAILFTQHLKAFPLQSSSEVGSLFTLLTLHKREAQ